MPTRNVCVKLAACAVLALGQTLVFAQTTTNPCPRFNAGSIVRDAANLYSVNGSLVVNLSYNTTTDSAGRTLYCFTTPDGKESPTLHIHPGDTLTVNVKNNLPTPAPSTAMQVSTSAQVCGAGTQDASSVNIHYHGTNTSPTCHSDEVIHTLINSGQSFTYKLAFPSNEPPGLYWYHPHVHGLAEAAVQGGASGVIVVEGIENVQPAVAGLPEHVLIVRDQVVPGSPTPGGSVPSWDVSVNYVPILYPNFTPAVLEMRPSERQFWRVSNSAADTILDLQLVYDGVVQPLQVVALDGVPTGSQDGTNLGKIVVKNDILIPPAGRAEFIVTGPAPTVKSAQLLTLNIDTGPDGDNDPQRPLLAIQTSPFAPEPVAVPLVSGVPNVQRFAGLLSAPVTATRTLYFSEDNAVQQFFITVDGATPVLFSANNPPAITTTQGSVEDWTIQNRALERHEFHMHQIHFLLMARDGVPVPPQDQQFLDMVDLPYWSGTGPYPSVTVRMDFRGPDVGDFVYHCHILNHEDNGMMAIIRVLPPPVAQKPAGMRKTPARAVKATTGPTRVALKREPEQ